MLNKLQSRQGAWSDFDSAVLKLEAKLTDLAWIVFARRFKGLASLRSVRKELERLLPDVVGIWIAGDKEEENEEDGEELLEEVEETPGDTLCDELEDDATEADQAEAAVHQDPAAPTSSTRKPDGWGSRSICKMLESLVVADIEGKGFSVGHKIHYLITGGGDNWMWKQRNRKANIEQFAIALSPESEEDSDSRDTATMVAIVRGKESPEMVRAVLEFVESRCRGSSR